MAERDVDAIFEEIKRLTIPDRLRYYEREDLATTLRDEANVLAAECERLRDILAAVAAPLAIDGPNHMASVKHARAALKGRS